MEKIERLTPEQEARFPEFVEKWTKIGLSTEPADRPRAEEAIRLMYQTAKLSPPKIVWCGSPLSQGITRAIVSVGASVGASVRASVGDSVWESVWDSVWASVWASVRESVWDSVWASVRDSVWASVWASVRDSVRDSVWDSVWASVRDSVRASVGDSVRASVGDSVRASVGASVGDSVWESVWASVGDSVRASVRASVWASVRDSVRDSVWASVRESVWDSVRDSVYGQHEAGWLSFYAYFRDVVGLTDQTTPLAGLTELAQSAGWALPHEKICWVCERPKHIALDDKGRLHSKTGPALLYPDGWAIYAEHGELNTPNLAQAIGYLALEKHHG